MNVKLPPLKTLLLIVCCLGRPPAIADAAEFSRGLLWKVERAGVAPSYLFGTMHSEDPQVLAVPEAVRSAFNQADALTLEVVLDPESLLLMAAAFMYMDGPGLESRLDAATYRQVVKAMQQRGMPELMVAGMKPWAVAVSLTMPPAKTGVALDMLLYQWAQQAGKPVHGLETPAEQMAVFDEMSETDQLALLRDALDKRDQVDGQFEALKAAYLARDLQRMVELSDAAVAGQDAELVETFNRRLILDRNHRMAQRMQEGLQAGNRFIAVGALHLPGEEGLLELLSDRGYVLTPVY